MYRINMTVSREERQRQAHFRLPYLLLLGMSKVTIQWKINLCRQEGGSGYHESCLRFPALFTCSARLIHWLINLCLSVRLSVLSCLVLSSLSIYLPTYLLNYGETLLQKATLYQLLKTLTEFHANGRVITVVTTVHPSVTYILTQTHHAKSLFPTPASPKWRRVTHISCKCQTSQRPKYQTSGSIRKSMIS